MTHPTTEIPTIAISSQLSVKAALVKERSSPLNVLTFVATAITTNTNFLNTCYRYFSCSPLDKGVVGVNL
jgi:hypothetical protein